MGRGQWVWSPFEVARCFRAGGADVVGEKFILQELSELDADPQVSPIMDDRYDLIKKRRAQEHEISGYRKMA